MRKLVLTLFAMLSAAALSAGAATAQTKITVGKTNGGSGFHVPSYVAMDQGFFKAEGLDASFVTLQGRALVTAGLSGSVNFVPIPSGGAQAALSGADIRYVVGESLKSQWLIAARPEITKPEDLKGKTVAATTSSGFYGMAVLFLRQHGLDPRDNLNIINASPAAVQTQLLAGKTEVGLMADPGLSNLVMNGFHIVGDMKDGIRKELKMPADAPIWYIGAYAHADWVDENPGRAEATMKMWREAAEFYEEKPDEADKIISEFTKLPVEALKTSRKLGLASFKVVPAIDEKDNLNKLFQGFKSVGFLTEVPDDGIYYKWPKK